MDHSQFYKEVYDQDAPDDGPHGWIQWKGTEVCIDLHCKCGAHGHFDGTFFYHYECNACGRKYAVGAVVRLIELTPEQAAYVHSTGGFDSDRDLTPADCGGDAIEGVIVPDPKLLGSI